MAENETRNSRPMRGPGMRGGAGEKPKNFKLAAKRLVKELNKYKVLLILSLVVVALSSVLSIFAPNKLSEMTDVITEGVTVNKDNLEEIATKITSKLGEKNIQPIQTMPNQEMAQNLEMTNEMISSILPEFEIDGVTISPKDQLDFMKIMSTLEEGAEPSEVYGKIDEMPESIQKVVKPFMNIDKVKSIALFLLVLYLVSALFAYIEGISMTKVANNFARSLRTRITTKINKLPLKYFDKHQSGDILSRVTNDVDTIAQSMNQSLATLVSAVTLFVGTTIMMFYTNWILALTAIFSTLIGFAGMFIILGKSQKYFLARQTELGNLNGHIEEIYSGLNVVKVYNGKNESDRKFDELNKKVCESNRKSQFLSGLMQPMMNFIGNFGYVAVCVVGALLTINNVISFGVIIAFISYVRMFTSPLSQIAQTLTYLQSTAAASERVFEFLDEEEMSDQKEITKKLDKNKVEGNINFENVIFQYDGNDSPTIKNFTASAKAGQKIAIVGPTGAGKTTMVNLLMKFYEINRR